MLVGSIAMMIYKFLQVGYGKMGKAIVDNLDAKALGLEISIIDQNISHDEKKRQYKNSKKLSKDFEPDIFLIACKPQNIQVLLDEYKEVITSRTIIISILAGTNISYFSSCFPENPIVRLMPNLGAKIKKSTNLIYGENIDSSKKELISSLSDSFGKTVWLEEEHLLHAGTAVAGSGPAYYYKFLSIYSNYLINAGFSADDAKKIAINTAEAAIETAHGEDFSSLIKQVSSKGGTTEAALNSLSQDSRLEKTLDASLNEAVARSKALSN